MAGRAHIKANHILDFFREGGIYGIASTPGIVIDGKVVHAGGPPKAEDVAKWLKA